MKRSIRILCAILSLAATALAAAGDGISERIYQAIRNHDMPALVSLAKGATVNARDRRGTTPLMYAAAVGGVDAMKLLLRGGANPNAKNNLGVTALLWAAGDSEKVRLLLANGARVNAQSKLGRTALMSAAFVDGNSETVGLLAAKGAAVTLRDSAQMTALSIAAIGNDSTTVSMLLGKGADPSTKDALGFTPLYYASMNGNLKSSKMLLERGADPNAVSGKVVITVKHGPFLMGLTRPLHEATSYGGAETVRALLGAGADANALDLRGMTPLTMAVATDRPDLEVIRLLLEKGANPLAKSSDGEDAIDWARKFRNPEVLSLFGVTGAGTETAPTITKGNRTVMASVEHSVALLQRTGASFLKEGGCYACHAQYLIGLAVRAARDSGVAVDDGLEEQSIRDSLALRGSEAQGMWEMVEPPGGQDTMMYALLHMKAGRVEPNRVTDAIVHYLYSAQHQDGQWILSGDPRPPIEDSSFFTTAMGLRSLQIYGIPSQKAQFDSAIQRAAAWLRNSDPRSTTDRNFQLLGLRWATGAVSQEQLSGLLQLQKADGGWAQAANLASDAYATGQVLYTLHELGVAPNDPAYQRGVAYLLNTQEADGSWHVRSRSPKIQPYFESGFPHGGDQWVSSAGTAWAAIGLAYAIPNPPKTTPF